MAVVYDSYCTDYCSQRLTVLTSVSLLMKGLLVLFFSASSTAAVDCSSLSAAVVTADGLLEQLPLLAN
jgi:hypothetical protein